MQRDKVLREFPAEAPPEEMAPSGAASDDDARAKIRAALSAHGGFLSQEKGAEIGTIRRWIKGGLSALTDQKPALILAEDLVQFLAARKAAHKKCGPAECYLREMSRASEAGR